MAETKQEINNKQQLGAGQNARIFVMPEQYQHGKEAKVVVPEKIEKISVVTTAQTPPPLPPKPTQPAPINKGTLSTMKALLIAGVVVILALVVVGYLLIRSAQKTEAPAEQSQVTQPTPRPSTEQPKEETEEIEEEEEVVTLFPTEIVPGKDTDSDGLTDVEEKLIYKSDINLPDTDSDGFLDGNEVFHLYNPNGTAPGTLLGAGLILSIKLPIELELVYPSIWQTQMKEDGSVSVLTTTGESFVMAVRSQTQEAIPQTTSNWMTEQGGQEQVVKTITKKGHEFYITQNKRAALVVVGSTILSFVYEIPTKTTADYVQTFQMMLNSLDEVVL